MSSISIIIPVYNEMATLEATLKKIISKKIKGITTREIIIVESNSSDGSKEIIENYNNEDLIKIFQKKPLGKGNAVREGFKYAKNDIILIQDADDEYDVEDYDKLIKPILNNETNFVLGSRIGSGNFKMRDFHNQPFLSLFMNLGHWFFTFLINTLFFVWLRDPFTMYKVFRRELINNMKFKCNRFDFDHELIIKLILSVHKPKEIPVNYSSRSYKEGKKVNLFKDPLTWIYTIIRLRVGL